jgi:excisionase family DNA binding protein
MNSEESAASPARLPVALDGSTTDAIHWLSLKEASEFLGVHFTTLRSWADDGAIRVFRTPGGHRRFSLSDLRRFLEERANHSRLQNETALIETAVGLVQKELQSYSAEETNWHYPLDESANDSRRQRGRQLFALAIAYVLKPSQRGRLLEEGRRLGYEYGREAQASKVRLPATGRAVRFFRTQLVQAVQVHTAYHTEAMDAEDVRIQSLIDQFLDEVLYAVLDGYEAGVRETNERSAQSIDAGQS